MGNSIHTIARTKKNRDYSECVLADNAIVAPDNKERATIEPRVAELRSGAAHRDDFMEKIEKS